jgi:hypothetical protein
MLEQIRKALSTLDRQKLLIFLAASIHALTITARYHYESLESFEHMREINEAIHRLSGHVRDLLNAQEPLLESRIESIIAILAILHVNALDRLYTRFMS